MQAHLEVEQYDEPSEEELEAMILAEAEEEEAMWAAAWHVHLEAEAEDRRYARHFELD